MDRVTTPFLSVNANRTACQVKPLMTGHLTCRNCGKFSGDRSDDVSPHFEFVNGTFTRIPLCDNAMYCYNRRKARFADSEVD